MGNDFPLVNGLFLLLFTQPTEPETDIRKKKHRVLGFGVQRRGGGGWSHPESSILQVSYIP
jgi:hypothetical protein